jgi:hypothetical protein
LKLADLFDRFEKELAIPKYLFEIRQRDGPPQVVGEVADQQLVDEVDGPEDIVDEKQEPAMVIVPADHQRVEAEDEIDDTGISVIHAVNITKKRPYGLFLCRVILEIKDGSLRRRLLRRRLLPLR